MSNLSLVQPSLDVADTLRGKHVLFAGATGFVGKVALSMLLERFPELGGVHVLVRPGSAGNATERFFQKIAPSEPFQPLRDRYGDGVREFFEKKCTIHSGDVTDPLWGLKPEQAAELKGKIAAVINCAGLVSFDPSLEVGIDVNVVGVQNAVELCLQLDAPLVHISTCFVVGNRPGQVFENEKVLGYFPKQDDLDGRDFDVDSELLDCRKLVAQARERADDHRLAAEFRTNALERLHSEGRDPDDERAMRLAMGRERKLWLVQELTRIGMERAQSWGWPNTYTYTKSLGEQVMAKAESRGLSWCTVRPSIVESALRYPFPGWNEGFTTSAPLTFMAMKGHRQYPTREDVILDIIPVDLVAGGLIAITAAAIRREQKRVYQLSSSDTNPLKATRVTELTGLYRRRYYRNREGGSEIENVLKARLEPKPVSLTQYQATSAPLVRNLAQTAKKLIDQHKPRWGAPRLGAWLERAREQLDEVEDKTRTVVTMMDVFVPFIWENHYIFRSDHTRELYQRLSEADTARIPWDPHQYDWRTYWMEVHMPGMEKWVYPGLEEETNKGRGQAAKSHRDLLELFEAAVEANHKRVALRMFRGEDREHFTYDDVRHFTLRVGRYLVSHGVKKADRVMLMSENRPEWPISYFGILKTGAAAVPVDAKLSEAEVVNLAKSCNASVLLVSDEVLEELPDVQSALEKAGLKTRVHTLPQALEGGPPCKLQKNAQPEDVASLIFTSGTTGNPKAVMLTHRNFSSLVAKLTGVFDLRPGDGVLSVLPMHHTFEFSCGMLLPFSRGAEITYLDELTSDRLGDALESSNVTAMIGVPALWQLLHRKITQELAARPKVIEQGMKALMSANAELRNRGDFNLGKLLFWPVHRKLGGRLRYLVSGGSALSPEVHEAFHAMGFNIAEGYGLTESSPVLTVTPVQNKRVAGSVGKPLSGIEIKIHEPDAEGIGEVIAKGPNVMAGYFENREATDAVLREGWLYTGDLGRIDDDGNLYLVGRKKDVIIDANGKNVYPDELEELYQKHDNIKELSIVGLPEEGGSEKVACLCVPDYQDRPREEVRRELEQHFRDVSAAMPFYRRVKVLHFWDGTLPRTATRKVKRKLVIDELKRLDRIAQQAQQASAAVVAKEKGDGWLYDLIAEVSQQPRNKVTPATRLATDLGFDSLMLTELSVGLESAGVALPAIEDLSEIQTVAELARLVRSAKRTAEPAPTDRAPEADEEEREEELSVPEPVARWGRKLLGLGQKMLYESAFDVRVFGRNYIPKNKNFLVVANHTSHLDMGLVKLALGEEGERLTALAARDYFFNTPLKRAYFENFTNLIPMDRHGSLKQSLRLAGEAIDRGYHLLIFPEGTRSKDGKLAEFKPTTGYLALTHDVDILPMFIEGAYEALPKGAVLPKGRDLKVRIGPSLRIDQFREQATGLPRSEAYRLITSAVEDAVRALSEGKVVHGTKKPHKPKRTQLALAREATAANDDLSRNGSNGHRASKVVVKSEATSESKSEAKSEAKPNGEAAPKTDEATEVPPKKSKKRKSEEGLQ
jgi:long-chain acyl-CoA synthetase